MHKMRFRYSKTGRAGYISHLDLMSVMQRSFRRAGVRLKYSEGFNPHPYMSVALPLSVGCESVCELIDVAVIDEDMPVLKTLKFPEGISIIEAYKPERKFNDITWIEIVGNLHYNKQITDDLIEGLRSCLNRDSIIISKRTKRGQKDLDIAPFIKDAEFRTGEYVSLKAKISAQNPTINFDDILKAFDDELKPDHADIRRIEIYDKNMIVFR